MIARSIQRPAKHGAGGLVALARVWLLAVVALVGASLGVAAPARAQIGSERYSSIVIDARTGRELSSVNADEQRYPASLTKMMTLYLTFEALRDHRIARDTLVPVSPHAASMVPSKLGLVPGTRLTVEQAILGLVTQSANDAAAALGELLGGSEEAFASTMTLRAHGLGMAHTTFRNASGLPDTAQMTTARDLARLALHLVDDFPAEYRYFSTPSLHFHGRVFANHDHLLESYPGADGIKTGYITASGFNLVTSAMRGDVRLIGVVLGAARAAERDHHMEVLLDQGFAAMDEGAAPGSLAMRRVPLIAQANAAQAPPPPTPPTPPALPRWAVQVGAFGSASAARQAAEMARKWTDSGQIHVEAARAQGHSSWRAELVGLQFSEANSACNALARHKLPCLVLRPDAG
jgi:D-alanyl-D-alanine carboxypeptidase